MKKSLIALAVAAALPAFAQAQTNVTLYGIADVNVGHIDPGGSDKGTMSVQGGGGQSTSRWGIRGSESLGGGLNAIFKMEAHINFDNGATDSTYWQRSAYLGLQGGFGEIRLGRDYTTGFSAAANSDVMGYGLYGNWLTFTTQAGITTRASNAIFYTSPALGNTKCMAAPASTECNAFSGGLTITGFYSFAAGTGAQESTSDPVSADDGLGAAVVYKGGPLVAHGYYQVFKANVAGSAKNNKEYGLGGGWNFGMVRVTAGYGVSDPNGDNNKHSGFNVGVGVKLGGGELLGQIIQQKVDVAGSNDPKATSWGIAFVQPMSKRTNWYASIGQTRNNDYASYPVLASGYSIASGGAVSGVRGDPRGIMLGVRHMF